MSDLPTPHSLEQVQANMLSSLAAKLGVDDFAVGSALTSFVEVMALVTARTSGDIFQVLTSLSLDRATGDLLKRYAKDNKVTLVSSRSATGSVTVLDTSFQKISTKVYSGANPPNIGSAQVKVSDASLFTPTGSVYIGRGTPNIEGPIPYTSITPVGGYYVLNLSAPTAKFHNVGETVVMAQGGIRSVPVNSIVVAPASGATPDVQFKVTSSAVILDGEVSVSGVQVAALTPGSTGNVPIGGIKQFSSPPFTGATVSNPLKFTTGKDTETDDELRVRIKRKIASTGLGTASIVKGSVIDATTPDEQSTIVSSEIVSGLDSSTLYIDDGSGYEAKTQGVGLESIVDSALGGEQYFQLATGGRQAPVAKAFLESSVTGPFDIIGGDTLSIIVGEQTYEHIFNNADFRSPGGATAYEITASINANTTLGFEAVTSESGQKVVVRSKEEGLDSLKSITPTTNGRDASALLFFPANEIQTIRLYKNKVPLSKDGSSASLFTQGQELWSPAIAGGDTLVLSVDGTDFITYTFADADFIATGLYNNVSPNNSLESWAQVMNSKLTGVTVAVVGSKLRISSNLGVSSRAKLSIDSSSTLVSKGMFNALAGLTASGKASDFELDRNTAQVKLTAPLVAGDQLSGGSFDTEARVESLAIPSGSLTLSNDGHMWILSDVPGEMVNLALPSNSLISVSKPTTNVIRYTSSSTNAFVNVAVGDYVIVWSEDINVNNRLEGRVNAFTATTLDILVTPTEYAAAVVVSGAVYTGGFVVLRSELAPQKFKVSSGTKTLDQITEELQTQTDTLTFSVDKGEFIIVNTNAKGSEGAILIVTADNNGRFLTLPSGVEDFSKDSLIAFYDTITKESQLPLFIHSSISAGTFADPIDSYIPSFQSAISLSGRDPNEMISILHPYGAIRDAQPAGETDQETAISGTTVSIVNQSLLRRLRSIDRYFIANPLDFGYNDSLVVVLDGDTTSKSFNIPLYRKALTNTTLANNPFNFNAYDVDSGSSSLFSSAFGSFDFSNFKVLMQAKKTLKPAAAQSALLYRATKWGRSGEKVNVGYSYPTSASQPISSTVLVGGTVDVRVSLKSGTSITTGMDNSTQWNVTIAANTPSAGIDQVTYTWNSVGANPTLSLSGGEYVNISSQSGFNSRNTGVFRVSTQSGYTPTSTSFSVQRPNGAAIAQSNAPTSVNGAISFYNNSSTTAAEVSTYVNSTLSDYVTTTIVNDSGTAGSGVIVLSTYEESGFQYQSQYLMDGINWIYTSNIGGGTEFTFKKSLSLSSDVGYQFNNGETVRLIPTTMDQVKRLSSVLAVTGFTATGTIDLIDRGSKLELSTDVLGSNGSIQVIGGLANGYDSPVLDAATRIDNTLMSVSSNKVSSQGIASDQWLRLQAATAQRKDTLISSNTTVSIQSDTPTTGQSTVSLGGRTLFQRYLGKQRHHIRSMNDRFRVEKQGNLSCISWNNTGSSPGFLKSSLNFNDTSGGTLNFLKVSGSNDVEIQILTGNTNFNELSIGDLLTIASMGNNSGTFLVTAVSTNGQTIRVLNPAAANDLSSSTFTLVTNATSGDTFNIGANALVAGTNFVIGGSAAATAINLSSAIGSLAGYASTVNSNIVTVTSTSAADTSAISHTGTGTVTISHANLVGRTFAAGNFSASSAVSEGDTVVFSAPFASLNQGRYRVVRRYNDSIWIENVNVVEEEVTLPANLISLGFDGTTSFKVNGTNHSAFITWNGTGTEPTLENALMGDVVTFGNDFASANRGSFMVQGSGSKLPQITTFTLPPGTQFTLSGNGKYFLVNSAGDVNQYYIWFNVNSTNADPAVGGKTGAEVDILSGDSAAQVAVKAAAILTALTGITASASGNTVTVTTTGSNTTTAASNVNMPSPFLIDIIQLGRRAYMECINPFAVNESSVLVSGTFNCHRPQIQFWEYEATVAGDKFVATGDTLTSQNAGTYPIIKVLDRDTMVVSGTLAPVRNASLSGSPTSVYTLEGVPYSGYKHVLLVSAQPGTTDRNQIVFDSNQQYEKIDEAGIVSMSSVSKLNFPTKNRVGLDSYRYNTGLIAEANRIIYGDPRDPETYSGVGAAGANIYVREPLVRRVQVAVVIRVNTGVPFSQVAEQVRNSVNSLVNSNDVGQPIAISAIVSAINAIPGIRAVSISSPQFDSTHDLIYVSPAEKSVIIDASVDISVAQAGT